jgi:FtsH-binding integral membrane protein
MMQEPVRLNAISLIAGVIIVIIGVGFMGFGLFLLGSSLWRAFQERASARSADGYFYMEFDEITPNTYTPNEDEEAGAAAQEPVAVVDQAERLLFMRKVFGTLAFEYFLTFLAVIFCTMYQPAREWILVTAPTWLSSAVAFVGLVAMFPLMIFSTKYPYNLIAVTAFVRFIPDRLQSLEFPNSNVFWCLFSFAQSVIFGFVIGIVCAWFTIVIYAFTLLFVILGTVTIFTLFARGAFPYFWAMIGCFVSLSFSCGFLTIFLPLSSGGWTIASLAGAFLFSIFLIWDMAIIAHYFSTEMWALGAVIIYLDSLNIFMNLLRFLGNKGRE